MSLENCYGTRISNILVEGSGKCQKIRSCEYLYRDTFRKLSKEDGIKQLIICVSDYQLCYLNKEINI